MFHDRPERHCVEPLLAEILCGEVAADHSHAAALRIIQWWAAHIRAQNLVAARKALIQLKPEAARRTSDIQHGAVLAVLPEYPQLPLESHSRVVTLKLGRAEVVIRPGLV